MSSKHIVKVRISPELNVKILENASKKEEKKSAYARRQLESESYLPAKNLNIIREKILGEIKKLGIKVNYKARLYNTYGAIEADKDLKKILDEIISVLKIIVNLLLKKVQEQNVGKKNQTYEAKRKTVNFTFALDNSLYNRVIKQAEERNISMSSYIRSRLENPVEYTKQDLRIMRQQIHHQIYPIVSNVEQICFIYAESNIRHIYLEIRIINEKIADIIRLENTILQKLELEI